MILAFKNKIKEDVQLNHTHDRIFLVIIVKAIIETTVASKIFGPSFNCILALADKIIALHSSELTR